MNGQIFISYRRDDSQGSAGRLCDRLAVHFGRNKVFMDVDTIQPGVDFAEAIEEAVGSCDVLIAVIGKHWLISSDPRGARRLDIPEDFVRLEIATALRRRIRVVPVLVEGASMPEIDELPDDLKALVRRQAMEIGHNRFSSDSDRLIVAVEQVLEKANVEQRKYQGIAERLDTERAQPEAKERPPPDGVAQPTFLGKRKLRTSVGIAMLLALVLGLAVAAALYLGSPRQSAPASVSPRPPVAVIPPSPSSTGSTTPVVEVPPVTNPPVPIAVATPNPAIIATPPAQAGATAFDTRFYYRLTNDFLGQGKSLDVYNDGSYRLRMSESTDSPEQLWKLVDSGGEKYSIRNAYLGNYYSLDVINDDKNDTPFVAESGNYSGQVWTLTPWGDGTFKLTNDFTGPEKSLDTYSDTHQPFLSTGNHSGQHWRLIQEKTILPK